MPLPLPNDALRAINVYVLQTPDGLVLVDACPRARRAHAHLVLLAAQGRVTHSIENGLESDVDRKVPA